MWVAQKDKFGDGYSLLIVDRKFDTKVGGDNLMNGQPSRLNGKRKGRVIGVSMRCLSRPL